MSYSHIIGSTETGCRAEYPVALRSFSPRPRVCDAALASCGASAPPPYWLTIVTVCVRLPTFI